MVEGRRGKGREGEWKGDGEGEGEGKGRERETKGNYLGGWSPKEFQKGGMVFIIIRECSAKEVRGGCYLLIRS